MHHPQPSIEIKSNRLLYDLRNETAIRIRNHCNNSDFLNEQGNSLISLIN